MPTYARKYLRQTLGQTYLRDVVLGTTALSLDAGAVVAVLDSVQADPSFSGDRPYERAYLRVASADYRVGSFNTGSGAFVTLQTARNPIASGADYEVSSKLSAADKDLALDDTVRRLRVRQEVAVNSVERESFYPIDGAASPYALDRVLDVQYFGDPTNSLSRQLRRLEDWRIVTTASGRELRIKPALAMSLQLVLDAILIPSLGADDAATLNIPSDRWVLAGAAARCYDFQVQGAPGQQVDNLLKLRAGWAAEFSRLSALFAPNIEEAVRFHEPGD